MNILKELSAEEFAARVNGGARTPVFREFPADRETPVSVLTRVSDEESVFLLESVTGGENCGRYSFLGIDPYATYAEHGKYNPLTELRPRILGRSFTPAPELPPLQGGAIGYLAYDAVRTFVPRVGLTREEGTPTAEFLLTDTILVFDHVRQTVIISYVTGPEMKETVDQAYARARQRIADIYRNLLTAESIARYVERRQERKERRVTPFVSEMTQAEFTAMVLKCKEAIKAGEVIQIVPSQKFTAETDVSPLALYRALRMVNPSPYNFFLKLGAKTLIGSSPEELVKLQDGVASTCPIAGTRPRGRTAAEDAALEEELKNDVKERAEHVMLVDLGRNDLGRVAKIGSVQVDQYAHVERYSHVMHLVSRVHGELAEGLDAFDLLEAAFPAGTLSGAPKVRAMELIAQFEKSPRGIYGGAAGYFSYTGDMDFAIVIRTMLLEKGKLVMRAGAGIVADSDPVKEFQETVNKSKAIFAAAQFATTL
ncbi:MAG: anthranilate synthase component I family protein [Kiritimatiellia bacterium]